MKYFYSFLEQHSDFTFSLLLSDFKGRAWYSLNGQDFVEDGAVEIWRKKDIYKKSSPLRKHEWLIRTFRNGHFASAIFTLETDMDSKEIITRLWKEMLKTEKDWKIK